MGFPRILSKNNKIYTKLGEFCLSGDSFWIVCHTCQEELQTQDAFWKHIQDEHNFLHGVAKQEHSRTSSYCLTDVEAAAATSSVTTAQSAANSVTAVSVPLALYHCASKYTEEEQVELHEAQQQQLQQQQHQQQQQQKDLELHAVDANTRNNNIDIKVEPSSLTLSSELHSAAATVAAVAAGNLPTTIYHLAQVQQQQQQQLQAAPPPPPPTPNFSSTTTAAAAAVTATTVAAVSANLLASSNSNQQQQHNPNQLLQQTSSCNNNNNNNNMTVVPLLTTTTTTTATATTVQQELPPKDSNSTTASASSAVSSDDGERWYTCDYENCRLRFKYKSRMELHRVVHSKERRFNCDMCSASFKQSCNLSTHRKKKHSMRGIKSEQLPLRF